MSKCPRFVPVIDFGDGRSPVKPRQYWLQKNIICAPAKGASGQNLDPGFESLRLRQNNELPHSTKLCGSFLFLHWPLLAYRELLRYTAIYCAECAGSVLATEVRLATPR